MKNKYMKTWRGFLWAAGVLVFFACENRDGDYDASGTFESTEITVSSQGNGQIMEFNLEEGDRLHAGQCAGYIDTVQLYLKKIQMQASARSVKSRFSDISKQIAATKEQIAKAENEKDRFENLLKANAGTRKQVDDLESQINVLKKQLAAQLSTLEKGNSSLTQESTAVEIQIAQMEDLIRKCYIISPIEGTVLVKYAQRGELAAQGKPLFKIADIRHMYLRAYITAAQLTRLKIGQSVTVYADSGEKGFREYPGTVTWIPDKAEFTPKTIQTRDERANLVYAVKITVENDGYIKIGMYGQMKLSGIRDEGPTDISH